MTTENLTVSRLASDLGVLPAIDAGLEAAPKDAGAKVLACPIRRGRSTSRRHGAAHYLRIRVSSGAYVVQPVSVTIHPVLLDTPELREQLATTFLHEVAHLIAEAISPNAGHGPIWKRTMRTMGCAPNRLATSEEAFMLAKHTPRRNERVVARCKKCGFEVMGMRRRTKYARGVYLHINCGGRMAGVEG